MLSAARPARTWQSLAASCSNVASVKPPCIVARTANEQVCHSLELQQASGQRISVTRGASDAAASVTGGPALVTLQAPTQLCEHVVCAVISHTHTLPGKESTSSCCVCQLSTLCTDWQEHKRYCGKWTYTRLKKAELENRFHADARGSAVFQRALQAAPKVASCSVVTAGTHTHTTGCWHAFVCVY